MFCSSSEPTSGASRASLSIRCTGKRVARTRTLTRTWVGRATKDTVTSYGQVRPICQVAHLRSEGRFSDSTELSRNENEHYVLHKATIDDYWNIDGEKSPPEPWIDVTRFELFTKNPPECDM